MGPGQQSQGCGEGTGAESAGAGLGIPAAGRSGAAGLTSGPVGAFGGHHTWRKEG